MTRPARGIDRIKQQRLKRGITAREEALRGHKQICAQCHNAGDEYAKSCDEGWRLIKEIKRATNMHDVYMGTQANGQLSGQMELF